jgi:hypothetical protein
VDNGVADTFKAIVQIDDVQVFISAVARVSAPAGTGDQDTEQTIQAEGEQ